MDNGQSLSYVVITPPPLKAETNNEPSMSADIVLAPQTR